MTTDSALWSTICRAESTEHRIHSCEQMLKELLITSTSLDPKFNQSVAQYLGGAWSSTGFHTGLFLYSSTPFLSLGRYQNCFGGFDRKGVEASGIRVLRRDIGGSTLYHNLSTVQAEFFWNPGSVRPHTDAQKRGYDFRHSVARALNKIEPSADVRLEQQPFMVAAKSFGSSAQHTGVLSAQRKTVFESVNLVDPTRQTGVFYVESQQRWNTQILRKLSNASAQHYAHLNHSTELPSCLSYSAKMQLFMSLFCERWRFFPEGTPSFERHVVQDVKSLRQMCAKLNHTFDYRLYDRVHLQMDSFQVSAQELYNSRVTYSVYDHNHSLMHCPGVTFRHGRFTFGSLDVYVAPSNDVCRRAEGEIYSDAADIEFVRWLKWRLHCEGYWHWLSSRDHDGQLPPRQRMYLAELRRWHATTRHLSMRVC